MRVGNAATERILNKVINIIEEIERPITINEIEMYIRGKDEQTWQLLKSKPQCYLKTVINLECPKLFKRYKTKERIRGVDRRAIFYGLTKYSYSESEWRLIESKYNSIKNEYEKKPPKADPSFILLDNSASEHFRETTSEETGNVWNYLIRNIPKSDPIWSQLLSAINDIFKASQDGNCNPRLLNHLFSIYNLLNVVQYKYYFEIILSREIILRKNK